MFQVSEHLPVQTSRYTCEIRLQTQCSTKIAIIAAISVRRWMRMQTLCSNKIETVANSAVWRGIRILSLPSKQHLLSLHMWGAAGRVIFLKFRFFDFLIREVEK